MGARTLGIISDTHGKLPPEVFTHFEGVQAILHAGDVDSEDILIELEAIAPVRGVMGNMDGMELSHRLPLRDVVDLDGVRIGLAHGHLHGGPSDRHQRLREAFEADGVQAIIYGHTHRSCADTDENPWVLNPGSASQGRGHGRSIGLLRVAEDGTLDFQIVRLD